MRHEPRGALPLRDLFPGAFRQIHAGLQNLLVDLLLVAHAVNRQQRRLKRAGAEPSQQDIHVVRRVEPRPEYVKVHPKAVRQFHRVKHSASPLCAYCANP